MGIRVNNVILFAISICFDIAKKYVLNFDENGCLYDKKLMKILQIILNYED